MILHRTGEYISEVMDINPSKVLVKTLAVVTHPVQGDLHNRFKVDVELFHERKALAYQEKVNVPSAVVRQYEGEVPAYIDSLKSALEKEINKLIERNDTYGKRALQNLEALQAEYFRS